MTSFSEHRRDPRQRTSPPPHPPSCGKEWGFDGLVVSDPVESISPARPCTAPHRELTGSRAFPRRPWPAWTWRWPAAGYIEQLEALMEEGGGAGVSRVDAMVANVLPGEAPPGALRRPVLPPGTPSRNREPGPFWMGGPPGGHRKSVVLLRNGERDGSPVAPPGPGRGAPPLRLIGPPGGRAGGTAGHLGLRRGTQPSPPPPCRSSGSASVGAMEIEYVRALETTRDRGHGGVRRPPVPPWGGPMWPSSSWGRDAILSGEAHCRAEHPAAGGAGGADPPPGRHPGRRWCWCS